MDNHLYAMLMEYAECGLIPKFQAEYREYGKMNLCPSYEEVKALCTALNAIAKFAGYRKVTPFSFVNG